MLRIEDFFDAAYSAVPRYWWREPHAYSSSPDDHAASLVTQEVLRLAHLRGPGRALDLGSGEGADAIRLALMGWEVTAVELTATGADKIRAFADEAGARLRVLRADVTHWDTPEVFDLVICNGLLHYVEDKRRLCQSMQAMTVPGGINAVALWSSFTPVPACHRVVPTYPDSERGEVVSAYGTWRKELLYFERSKVESGHDDMPAHTHSYIKLIAVKPPFGRAASAVDGRSASSWKHETNPKQLPQGDPRSLGSPPDAVVHEEVPRCAMS